ncbi:MAG: hypothetical protein HPY82_00835 [Gammaproteobacteria bacterium]|nr:hypothetical protein [Gammaproteobacteria bacterium]
MAKRTTEAKLDQLDTLDFSSNDPVALVALKKAILDKNNHVAAKAQVPDPGTFSKVRNC